jgi:aromatic-L-amino-acid/L-tryptophan decarboxylase
LEPAFLRNAAACMGSPEAANNPEVALVPLLVSQRMWLSLRYHGLAAFRQAISENLRQAQLLAQLIEAEPSLELLAPVELSAVCFGWRDGDDAALNRRNAEILRVREPARPRGPLNAYIRGAVGLRACIVNHRTTDDDVAEVVEEVLAAAQAV